MTTAKRRALAGLAIAGLALAACTNPGDSAAPGGQAPAPGAGDGQVVKQDPQPAGEGCTLQKYGAQKFDLKGATVGFSQSEPDTAAFRAAETASLQAAAKEQGVNLLVTNANNELPKQIADIQDLLAKNVKFLIVAPVNSDGLDPALAAAKAKGVPVLTIDRKVTNQHCVDYVAFLGSDFKDQGRRAADALAKATGGTAKVAVLLGSSGNNVTDDRNSGFKEQVKAKHPGLEIVAEQTGNFARERGQAVAEQLIQANPGITAIYAHNDEMALGAVTAVQAAGKRPGEDIKIVSIDGTRNAVQAIVDGKINAVIESNPRFGPLSFQTAQKFLNGEPIPANVIIEDDEYNRDNAAQNLANAF
ncbi:ABC transporter substrate-binding protein [Amycolatopsis suaedae]|uniref:ABC transporter substrate-binding protein n=1 Tax=Amycolatopsis suaedae TaxID=2510978 RepID=A0A4V2EM49_9PSEU|nr:ABC transporter substrate-binding protein [Amycolatopsis suaedae]RZQ63825.1 ABC transporter substrate-binding protein [Amycolatopsis suaedae]